MRPVFSGLRVEFAWTPGALVSLVDGDVGVRTLGTHMWPFEQDSNFVPPPRIALTNHLWIVFRLLARLVKYTTQRGYRTSADISVERAVDALAKSVVDEVPRKSLTPHVVAGVQARLLPLDGVEYADATDAYSMAFGVAARYHWGTLLRELLRMRLD